MAVEIFILSGARQGQRLVFDADQFTAGDAPGCEVYFDAQADSGAKGRSALFQRRDDGWYLRRTGAGEIYLDDYQPVGQQCRLRSGALVRLSEQGPDFEFRITAAKPSAKEESPLPAAAPGAAAATGPGPEARPAGPAQQWEPSAAPASGAPASAGQSQPAASPAAAPAASSGSKVWIAVVLGVVVLGVVVLGVVILGTGLAMYQIFRRSSPPPVVVVNPSLPPAPASVPPAPPVPPPTQPPAPEPPAAAPPVAAAPVESLKQRVLLLQVRLVRGKETSCWPFATGCLIREDTVLTAAAAACELAKLRSQKLALYATDGAGKRQYEIEELYIPRKYVELAQEPDRSYRYFNLALLTLKTKADREQVVSMASPEELAELKDGLRLKSVGFGHDGTKLARDEVLTPATVEGKIFVVTSPHPQAPDGPRLLHVTAPMPDNCCLGSPLVNAKGNVVGLYADVAVSDQEKKAIKDLRFFTVAAPSLIGAWLENRGSPLWMPAPVVEADADK